MYKLYLLILLLLTEISYSQTHLTKNQKIQSLITIWGLLKYQHPDCSRGYFNMNNEFLTEFEKIQQINTQDSLNAELLNWIQHFNLGKNKFKTNPNRLNSKTIFTKNANYNWIENSGFNSDTVELLKLIQNNTNCGDYYARINGLNKMVALTNENGLDNFDVTNESHRILFLNSFWNQMNYWNVNLHLTKQSWTSTLVEMIPEFAANDVVQFELAKDKLFSKLNDSHAYYTHSYLIEKKLNHFAYVGGKIVNDSLVVTSLFDKELAQKNGIGLGDVIFSIDGKTVIDYCNFRFFNVISASNENYLKSRTEKYFLLSSDKKDSVQIDLISKNGAITKKYLTRDEPKNYVGSKEQLEKMNAENFYYVSDAIGYLNLNKITPSEIKTAFKNFANAKGIIIDLRNYPKNISEAELPDFLYPEKKTFIKILAPCYPSYAEYDIEAGLKIVKNPFVAGKKNPDYYTGKIVLLVDRSTASKAEYIAMAIQQSPNCITIGEQTSGAPLNLNLVPLIDKTSIGFTGQGAFYPDDTEVQGKGIKIDYQVKESALNYNPNLYIEEAIKLIQQ